MFYSLTFLKHVHVQNVHFLPQYTRDNDVEQRNIPSGLLLMEYNFWARKIQWTRDFSVSTREHCLNGDRVKTCMTASALSLAAKVLFLPHLPFNTSCTVPSTSNLSRILVIVTLCGGVLQQHYPLSDNTSINIYVHRHVCLNTWTMNMSLCFSNVFWIKYNTNCIPVSFRCWEITFQRDTLYWG